MSAIPETKTLGGQICHSIYSGANNEGKLAIQLCTGTILSERPYAFIIMNIKEAEKFAADFAEMIVKAKACVQ